jgi:hypothetical protein
VRPTSGGRVELDLEAAGAEVVYRAALRTPDADFAGRARVRLSDGDVALAWEGETPPPPWLADLVRAFLRTEWRARRGADPEPWPARIHRWREAR